MQGLKKIVTFYQFIGFFEFLKTLNNLNPVVKVMSSEIDSYNGILTGTYTRPTERCHFE